MNISKIGKMRQLFRMQSSIEVTSNVEQVIHSTD
jgi:hypothetical protein